MDNYIWLENVSRYYEVGEQVVKAVENVSFEISKGELCVVLGASGAGKTTLLNLLGGMDKPTEGAISVDGKRIDQLSDEELTDYRREDVGFVFQFYNLMPSLTALENVELARQIGVTPLEPREVLEKVGLMDRMNNFPAQLSGGEQQRVSIARALCKNPTLLLCDEPTGALDGETGIQVLKTLKDLNENFGTTVAIITHNALVAEMASRVIHMKNGKIEKIDINETPKEVEEIIW